MSVQRRASLTRRRFLTIASAACLTGPGQAFASGTYGWGGIVLGARARIILDHPGAERIVSEALKEIDRLEDVFSLYRASSQISRLNQKGHLHAPAFELLECLSVARSVWQATEGAFDPTVQPLWLALAEARQTGTICLPETLVQARAAIGFDRVRMGSGRIELAPGQALTLNGIAQGYIADRVLTLLQRSGVMDVLVDTGEIVASGSKPGSSGGWPITIARQERALSIHNRAVATSAPGMLMLDPAGGIGHIFDPRNTKPSAVEQVTVSAESAAFADSVSTACCLASSRQEVMAILRKIKDVRLESLYLNT